MERMSKTSMRKLKGGLTIVCWGNVAPTSGYPRGCTYDVTAVGVVAEWWMGLHLSSSSTCKYVVYK